MMDRRMFIAGGASVLAAPIAAAAQQAAFVEKRPPRSRVR